MNRKWKRIFEMGAVLLGIYITLDTIAKNRIEATDIDSDNPYIKNEESSEKYNIVQNTYEGKVKLILDKLLAFVGLIVLSPLYGLISLAIYIDNPGPVFFTQKRVGKDKHFFYLHKYRSMCMSTPHDVPTHQLKNPEAIHLNLSFAAPDRHE